MVPPKFDNHYYKCSVEKILPSGDATLRFCGKLGATAYGWYRPNETSPPVCPGITRNFRPMGFMVERDGSIRQEDERYCVRMAWCEDNEPITTSEWDAVLDPYARMTAEGQPTGNCGLNCICDVEEEAIHELIRLDGNVAPQYPWYAERMENYLKYVWVRAVETGKAFYFVEGGKPGHYLRGPALSPDPVLQDYNITSEFVLFNTGLTDRRGDAIFAMLTRICDGSMNVDPKQYALWAEGIMPASHPVIRRIFSRNIRPKSGLDLTMAKTTYPSAPPRMNMSLGLSFIDDAKHIVEDNLQRIIDAGILNDGDDVREKLDEWAQDAWARASRDPLYMIPQFYYKMSKTRDGTQFYDGRFQFMLPLLCGQKEPVLALAIAQRPDANLAVTVLTKDMALGHARVIDLVPRFLGERVRPRVMKTSVTKYGCKSFVDVVLSV
jgi:hypothetical protein